ncbi:MAG: HlyD family efflux transporter periplasmic adaptor subunit [Simkaniaceae bacterium]|nr:HlyD family efflux transporter periplasmic adaptor subunit [Simkaniaceae bacterium]MCF7852207.1 HlyD family efflux transporter periplasmic adaptor subunit [Simkaniaceae bacterium]
MNRQHRLILSFWGICSLLFLAGLTAWLFHYRFIKYTDDAYVQGNQVYITPLHDGFVTSIHTDDSFLVKKGELLVTLDETDAKIALEQAKENLAQVVREVCELFHQVFVYRAEIDLKRATLIQNAQDFLHRYRIYRVQGVSIEDYEHSIAALRSQYASLNMSVAAYHRTRSMIQNTSIYTHPLVIAASDRVRDSWVRLYRCKIYSPVEGLVAQRTIQVGMWVPEGQPLMSVIPLNQIWINANYKETQIKKMRIGQRVDITTDFWGGEQVYRGTIVGLPGGAGNAFSLLPPQNLSGNWIKIVQRLPVRVALDPQEFQSHPLRLGLTCSARVDVRNQSGRMVPDSTKGSPLYETSIFNREEVGDREFIDQIIASNLDPLLSEYAKAPLELPSLILSLPPLLEEAISEDNAIHNKIDQQIDHDLPSCFEDIGLIYE